MFAGAEEHEVRWGLALDELEPTGVELRPRVPLPGHTELTGPSLVTAAPAKPLSEIIGPRKLDRLTVADDPHWLETIDNEGNLPPWLPPGLRELYSVLA
jgi:5-methylthioadenosine/S-adenosylhomocysteine deaminase